MHHQKKKIKKSKSKKPIKYKPIEYTSYQPDNPLTIYFKKLIEKDPK